MATVGIFLGLVRIVDVPPFELGGRWLPLAPFALGLVALAVSLPISTRIYRRQDH